MSTINVLGEVYEIIFENDIGLVNGVPISYKNSYILAEIFVFFLEKHPEFEREYDVCLAGHCLRAAHSDPFESNVSDSINI